MFVCLRVEKNDADPDIERRIEYETETTRQVE